MGIQMSLKAINLRFFKTKFQMGITVQMSSNTESQTDFQSRNDVHPNVIKYKRFWSKCHQIHGTSNGNCFRELISGSNVTKTLLKLMLSFINSMKCRQNFPPAAGNFHQIPPFFDQMSHRSAGHPPPPHPPGSPPPPRYNQRIWRKLVVWLNFFYRGASEN